MVSFGRVFHHLSKANYFVSSIFLLSKSSLYCSVVIKTWLSFRLSVIMTGSLKVALKTSAVLTTKSVFVNRSIRAIYMIHANGATKCSNSKPRKTWF